MRLATRMYAKTIQTNRFVKARSGDPCPRPGSGLVQTNLLEARFNSLQRLSLETLETLGLKPRSFHGVEALSLKPFRLRSLSCMS